MEILPQLPQAVTDLELVVCCGKGLGPNGEIDWVLTSRIELAVQITEQNPNAKLLLSGGIGLTSDDNQKKINEADAMAVYVEGKYPHLKTRYIQESNSTGSLEQLCLIKENYILVNNYKKIAIVTDEIHINRVAKLFDALMGDGYEIYYLGSKVDLYGKYRQLIVDWEESNLKKGAEELVKAILRGDHASFKKFDSAYRELRKLKLAEGESRLDFISPQEVVAFMQNENK